VANHDLVLSDLQQAVNDADTVFPFNKYSLIFDEAHHLADKAMQAGQAELDLRELLKALAIVPTWAASLAKIPAIAAAVDEACAIHSIEALTGTGGQVRSVIEYLSALEANADGIIRFKGGSMPQALFDKLHQIEGQMRPAEEELSRAVAALRSDKLAAKLPRNQADLATALANAIALSSWVRDSLKGLNVLLNAETPVKWLNLRDDKVVLRASPLDGADVLKKLLWEQTRAVPVMVSATLRDFKGFERYADRIGLPEGAMTLHVPPVFKFEDSVLSLPSMTASPKMDERKQFLLEVAHQLNTTIDAKAGTLVLMPSWALLKQLVPGLKSKYGESKVLVQGTGSLQSLLEAHKSRIDRGEGSILVGAATLAEGLDLPGNYCTHVIIVAIPFATPADPIEQERAERMGSGYFTKHSMPDALVRLVQMVGRLLRRESDKGTVTILDKRITSTGYGQKMLKALPPFKVVRGHVS
jgi:ATP-dependent DNA helicase DinG